MLEFAAIWMAWKRLPQAVMNWRYGLLLGVLAAELLASAVTAFTFQNGEVHVSRKIILNCGHSQ
jgi:hypothetical protein